MKKGFVWLDEAAPGILWKAMYATKDNFTGAAVDGYQCDRLAGYGRAGRGRLRAPQRWRGRGGLKLFLWDAYRPQRAVDGFLRWCAAPEDGKTKRKHYPHIEKTDIVPLGYVAARSGHSRGSAVDLTLARMDGGLLDMGGDFDLMDEISPPRRERGRGGRAKPPAAQGASWKRAALKPTKTSGWHYTLRDEPYPNTYFDFVAE